MVRLLSIAIVTVAGCASHAPAGDGSTEAPGNPGQEPVGSTTYSGDAFVPGPGDLSFVDEEGNAFNLLGQAYDGPLAGDRVQLGILPGMTAFWFAWSIHHPGARVWNNGVNNEGVEIQATGECGVPCDEIQRGCFGGRDCIPSIDRPDWTTADDDAHLGYLDDADRVLGLYVRGSTRAYPLDTLWTHEIVNDTWGDWAFSVTYCPLTGSGILVEGEQAGTAMTFGVSGLLYNSNLVMYDRTTESLYGQMRLVGIQGDNLGHPLDVRAVVDTTWGQWRAMFPDTAVLSDRNGPSGYPYGDYRTDHDDTFMVTNPRVDPKYPGKSYAIGTTIGGETVIYAFDELRRAVGEVGIVQDEIGGEPVVVAFDLRTDTAILFSRRVGDAVAHLTIQ